jgi:tetratricopeptide (TPR) repeat protein
MIPILLILAAQAPALSPVLSAAPSAAEQRFDDCVALVETDPTKAIATADAWRIAGGGVAARHCLALAYAAQGRYVPAAVAFEQAARDAERERDKRAANLWVQAGNARLAAKQPELARPAFDAAFAHGTLTGERLGEAHLDRARARAALNDKLDKALKLVPADPLAWLLSATLARRMNDLPRAQTDIAEAAKLAPDDASVALEAGNVAILSGAPEAAKVAWEGAVKNQPESDAGKSAKAALAALEADMAKAPPQ